MLASLAVVLALYEQDPTRDPVFVEQHPPQVKALEAGPESVPCLRVDLGQLRQTHHRVRVAVSIEVINRPVDAKAESRVEPPADPVCAHLTDLVAFFSSDRELDCHLAHPSLGRGCPTHPQPPCDAPPARVRSPRLPGREGRRTAAAFAWLEHLGDPGATEPIAVP